ncbi:MAG: glutamine-hydrolyzing carbamoyl-phosphate synthase small subunit [Cyclobacteriaceae bacterium]|nr:glutamine-hydrolyzing carbamoyl-phosphate synthase small subunit [Cyclobacteriaceae bacterium]MCH8516138.1 glutamine-hydrolyzing carbamoyl-phosphate synthase small subunit [Cyclobacteriaceae bacterium]
MATNAYLYLEDGTLFSGKAIGKIGNTGGELCFNTGMTGYQEIYTDPSYTGQLMVNTAPHIGNYGIRHSEQESDSPKVHGIIINEYSHRGSRALSDMDLGNWLLEHNIVGITDIDTRMLVRHIRTKGAMNAVISSESADLDFLSSLLREVEDMKGLELASRVCTSDVYFTGDPSGVHIAVLDLGIKKSILDNLVKRGFYCQVFPAKTSFEEMNQFKPSGFFISNGPGDPAATEYAIHTVKQILDADLPLFGICLGHQLLGLALGLNTYKLHHGHRGCNHPVLNTVTGKGEITSQNHGFGVSKEEIESSSLVSVTHINLNDGTVEGFKVNSKRAFSVQFHPEASPGPHDSRYLFDEFYEMVLTAK